MPSGVTHDRIAVAASPLLAGVAVMAQHWAGRPPLEALMGGLLFTASHLACSQWLSPDLDLGSATIDERWGALRPIWWPYERAIPHRHWLSHSGVSALIRLAYLFLALNLLLAAVALLIMAEGALVGFFIADTPGSREVWAFLRGQYLRVSTAGIALALEHPAEALAIALGALAADLLHTGADRIDTARKGRRRYRRRPVRSGSGVRRRT